MPKGSFTYFNVSCIDSQTNLTVDEASFLKKNKTQCQNLKSKNVYKINIITVAEKNDSIATNSAIYVNSTSTLFELE